MPKLEEKDYAVFRDAIVDDLLKNKGNKVHTVQDESLVLEAIKSMTENKIGATVVVDGEGNIAGMFSERDYMQKVILQGLRSHSTKVKDVMTPHPTTVTLNDSLLSCMQLITEGRFRHLPVKDEHGKLVSIGDLVAGIIGEYRHTIESLTEFIERKY